MQLTCIVPINGTTKIDFGAPRWGRIKVVLKSQGRVTAASLVGLSAIYSSCVRRPKAANSLLSEGFRRIPCILQSFRSADCYKVSAVQLLLYVRQLTMPRVALLTWHFFLEALGPFRMRDSLVAGRLCLATLTWVGHFSKCEFCCTVQDEFERVFKLRDRTLG